jgi:hypothetical protein
MSLVGGILRAIGDLDDKIMVSPRHVNAVVRAADEIMKELDRDDVMATPGMGLKAWLKSDDTGRSSKFMAHVLAPKTNKYFHLAAEGCHDAFPYDVGDFGRCVRMLDAVPELRPFIGEMSHCGVVWGVIAKKWPELEAWYRKEVDTVPFGESVVSAWLGGVIEESRRMV